MVLHGEYTWTDLNDRLKVSIPLKGVSVSKVDVRVTQKTLKINFSPYLIDIVLSQAIDPVKHKAVVKEGVLILTLFKSLAEKWLQLELDDDEATKQAKSDALSSHDELTKEISKKIQDRKISDERLAVRKQMNVDELERTRLEALKAEEKRIAEKEMYEVFSKLESEKTAKKGNVAKTVVSEKELDFFLEQDDIDDATAEPTKAMPSKPQANDNSEEDLESEIKYLPPPRTFGVAESKVSVNFSQRLFPTPLRESKVAEEDNWIAKNRQHLKSHGMLGDRVPKGNGQDIGDVDPVWLKAKGDDFFRSSDYKSAISAYNSAIEADASFVSAFSNRSACHLKLQMFSECKKDCDMAIRLVFQSKGFDKVDTEGERKESLKLLPEKDRLFCLKALYRRSIASLRLGSHEEACRDHEIICEYLSDAIFSQELLKVLNLTKESLLEQQIQMRNILNCDRLKRDADKDVAANRILEAIHKYTEALKVLPIHVGCISNRAACRLALEDYQRCVDDCSQSLCILESHSSQSTALLNHENSINILESIFPPHGSDKRKQWILKTILRRSMAFRQLGKIEEAIKDYDLALLVDPSNKDLAVDRENLINIQKCKEIEMVQ